MDSACDRSWIGRSKGYGIRGSQPFAETIHDHQRKGRLLTDQIHEAGMVDPHHAGIRRGCYRARGAGGAVDHGHLAEELAFAEADDDGLAVAVDLRDIDLAVENNE